MNRLLLIFAFTIIAFHSEGAPLSDSFSGKQETPERSKTSSLIYLSQYMDYSYLNTPNQGWNETHKQDTSSNTGDSTDTSTLKVFSSGDTLSRVWNQYNTLGKMTETHNEIYISGLFISAERTRYTYDGDRTIATNQYWYKNAWINSKRITSGIDKFGNNTVYIYEHYDQLEEQWRVLGIPLNTKHKMIIQEKQP